MGPGDRWGQYGRPHVAEQLGRGCWWVHEVHEARLPGKLRNWQSNIWKSCLCFHVLCSVSMSFVCARQLRSGCRRTIFLFQLVSFDDIIAFSTRINRCLTRIHGGDDGTWPHFWSLAYSRSLSRPTKRRPTFIYSIRSLMHTPLYLQMRASIGAVQCLTETNLKCYH